MSVELTDREHQIIQQLILDRWNPHRINLGFCPAVQRQSCLLTLVSVSSIPFSEPEPIERRLAQVEFQAHGTLQPALIAPLIGPADLMSQRVSLDRRTSCRLEPRQRLPIGILHLDCNRAGRGNRSVQFELAASGLERPRGDRAARSAGIE